jgi:hypothetical protein
MHDFQKGPFTVISHAQKPNSANYSLPERLLEARLIPSGENLPRIDAAQAS